MSDTIKTMIERKIRCKSQLINLISDWKRLYPHNPYKNITRTVVCMYGVLTHMQVNCWEDETGLKFDWGSWDRLTGAKGEIILMMAEQELKSNCSKLSTSVTRAIKDIKKKSILAAGDTDEK